MGSCTFVSRSEVEAETVVARHFEPHALSFEPHSQIDFRFTHFALSDSTSLSRLRYGAPAVIRTEHFESSLMVQMPLSGCNLLHVADEDLRLTPENYSLVVPGRALRQRRDADCEMLVIRIRTERIRDYMTAHLGFTPHKPLRFISQLQEGRVPGRHLRSLTSTILDVVDGGTAMRHVLAHYEQVLIATLLFEHPNCYTETMDARQGRIVPACVRKAEELIRANPGATLTTEGLARELGTNVRTLQLAFRKFRGCTPTQRVKAIRLAGIHEDLRHATPETSTVTDIAVKWGITHLGSFAREYRARFGVLPSETLRRA